jgi:hypothetical protein
MGSAPPFRNQPVSPPVTNTWDGSAVNAVNPAAPPPAPGSFTYTWSCALAGPNYQTYPPSNLPSTYVTILTGCLEYLTMG